MFLLVVTVVFAAVAVDGHFQPYAMVCNYTYTLILICNRLNLGTKLEVNGSS